VGGPGRCDGWRTLNCRWEEREDGREVWKPAALLSATAAATCRCITAESNPAQLRGNHGANSNDVDDDDEELGTDVSDGRGSGGGGNNTAGGGARNDGVLSPRESVGPPRISGAAGGS